MAVPFFGSAKCVVVRRFTISEISAKQMENLKTLLEDIPEYTTLIFLGTDAGGKKPGLKKGFPSWVDKVGAVFEFVDRDRGGLVRFLQGIASKEGRTISAGACDFLLQRTSTDMRQLPRRCESCALMSKKAGRSEKRKL